MSDTLATVVIPTHNRKDILTKVLHALVGQTFHHGPFEVVVIDDAGTDGTEAHIRANCDMQHISLTYVRQSANRGPAAARNVGVAAAGGKLIAFLDDDIVPCPDWLTLLIAASERWGPLDAVMGHVEFAPELQRDPLIQYLTKMRPMPDYRHLRPGQKVPFYRFQVGSLVIAKAALLEVGMFDERYKRPMGEDYELGYRLSRIGSNLYYEPRAVGYHYHPTTFESHCQLMRLHGENVIFHSQRFPDYDHDLHGAAYDQAHPLREVLRRGDPARRALRWFARHLLVNRLTAEIARQLVRLELGMPRHPGISYLFRVVFSYEYYIGMQTAVFGEEVE
jgi:glycosyltransferase involved in cell wall biosynthesis